MRINICDICKTSVSGVIPRDWLSYHETDKKGQISPVIDLCGTCAEKPFQYHHFKPAGLVECPTP
jgi:hypothetical protein